MVREGIMIIYSGNEDHCTHRVSLLLDAKAAKVMIGWKPDNESILTTRVQSRHAKVTVIQVYAPTEIDSDTGKCYFFNLLIIDIYSTFFWVTQPQAFHLREWQMMQGQRKTLSHGLERHPQNFMASHQCGLPQHLSWTNKLHLFSAIVLCPVLCASQTWKNTAYIAHTLNVFHESCLRKILGISWCHHMMNEKVFYLVSQQLLQDIITEYRFKFTGHVLQMPVTQPVRVSMDWIPTNNKKH